MLPFLATFYSSREKPDAYAYSVAAPGRPIVARSKKDEPAPAGHDRAIPEGLEVVIGGEIVGTLASDPVLQFSPARRDPGRGFPCRRCSRGDVLAMRDVLILLKCRHNARAKQAKKVHLITIVVVALVVLAILGVDEFTSDDSSAAQPVGGLCCHDPEEDRAAAIKHGWTLNRLLTIPRVRYAGIDTGSGKWMRKKFQDSSDWRSAGHRADGC